MSTELLYQQYKSLIELISSHRECYIFKELEIQHLAHETDLDLICDELNSQIPLFDYASYLNFIKRNIKMWDAPDATVLAGKNVIHPKRPKTLAVWEGQTYPVNDNFYQNLSDIEQNILSGQALNCDKIKGKVFQILDDSSETHTHNIPHAHLMTHLQRKRGYFARKRFVPHLDELKGMGRSRYQIIHAYLELLEKYGKEVEVLYCRPQILAELSIILSQREGRFVPLKELCPHLKMFIHYGESPLPYQKEIQNFMHGLPVNWVALLIHPSGVLGVQSTLQSKFLFNVSNELKSFFNFVEESEVRPDASCKRFHQRLHVGELKVGKRYLLVVNNQNGFLMFNSEMLFEIATLEPLTLRYIRQGAYLDHYKESLTSDLTDMVVSKINEAEDSYGFILRDYLMADDCLNEKMLWIFEVNHPISSLDKAVLQSVANAIHTDMMFKSKPYKHSISIGELNLPEITFVSTGTFSTCVPEGLSSHLETDKKAPLAKKLLEQAVEKLTLIPTSE